MARRGSTYLTVILILLALSAIAAAIATLTVNNRMASAAFSRNAESYYLSRSGAEIGTAYIRSLLTPENGFEPGVPDFGLIEATLIAQDCFVYDIAVGGYQYHYTLSYDSIAGRNDYAVDVSILFYTDKIELITHAREKERTTGVKMKATLQYEPVSNSLVLKTLQQI